MSYVSNVNEKENIFIFWEKEKKHIIGELSY